MRFSPTEVLPEEVQQNGDQQGGDRRSLASSRPTWKSLEPGETKDGMHKINRLTGEIW
jgi:hypothetical protein